MPEPEAIVGVYFGDERDEFPPEVRQQFQEDHDGATMWLAYARIAYEEICTGMAEGKDTSQSREDLAELFRQITPEQMVDVISNAIQLLDREMLRASVDEIVARNPVWSGDK